MAASFPFGIIQPENGTADMTAKTIAPSFVRDIPEWKIPGTVLSVLLHARTDLHGKNLSPVHINDTFPLLRIKRF